MKKIFLIVVLISLLLAVGAYFWLQDVKEKVFVTPTHSQNQEIIYKTIDEKFKHDAPFGIVLLGYAGGTHDGAALTDSIIVAYIVPKLQKVLLVSIPRDLFIEVPSKKGNDLRKINIAYIMGFNDIQFPDKPKEFKSSEGEGKVVKHVLSEVTGLPVEYFVSLDFSGFVKTIDTLGGVDINVQSTLDDPEYPRQGKEKETCDHSEDEINTYMATASADPTAKFYEFFPCRYEHLHFDTGTQHMDGTHALKYVRSRHSEQDGSDFGRAGRQRNLMLAVKDKIFSIGFIPQIIPFLGSLGDDARTDMTPDDVKTLLTKAESLNKYKIETFALTDDNFLKLDISEGGQSILIPREGQNKYSAIHQGIKDMLLGKKLAVPPLVLLQNGTKIAGLAALAKENLKKQGIESLPPASAPKQDQEKTEMTIYGDDIDAKAVEKIKKEFSISKVKTIANNSNQYNVLIVLGNDYAKKQQ